MNTRARVKRIAREMPPIEMFRAPDYEDKAPRGLGEMFRELYAEVRRRVIRAVLTLSLVGACGLAVLQLNGVSLLPYVERLLSLKSNREMTDTGSKRDAAAMLASIQAETGGHLEVPEPTRAWSKSELLELASDVTEEACRKDGVCFPPVVVQAILDKESSWDPSAVMIEESRIGKKVKHLEGEGNFSKALSPLSFGLMQINWGWHKQTCKELLEHAGGSRDSLYMRLFDPRINLRCAILVLGEKWREAGERRDARGKSLSGASRLREAVRLYNGEKAGPEYPNDVLNVRVVKLMADRVR